ncbi:MAG: (d)CMP kinase [SAR202 cluster bacterium]|jgi:adenylate kinase family enzyme|nr:(d)CMP kinase [SAR202 cluster bacterium]
MTTSDYRRITIHGHSGSGKSSLARDIGARLNLPVIELDALYHVDNWNDTPLDEFRSKIMRITESSPRGWVSAGNYFRTKDLLMDRADVVIWLRLPFHVVYWRLLWRTIRDLITRKPIWEGGNLKESWKQTFTTRDSILLWGIQHWKPHIRNMTAALETTPKDATILILRSSREVENFVDQLPRFDQDSSDG